MVTTDYIDKAVWERLLDALMPANRLALEVAIATGLRITDVLSLPGNASQRPTVHDKKTGKKHRVYIPMELWERLQGQRGRFWMFEGRMSPEKHRTRQAVWYDLHRASKLYRMPPELQGLVIAPHSARKTYAVGVYRRTGRITDVQRLLCHTDPSVTLLYAMADELTRRAHPAKGGVGCG